MVIAHSADIASCLCDFLTSDVPYGTVSETRGGGDGSPSHMPAVPRPAPAESDSSSARTVDKTRVWACKTGVNGEHRAARLGPPLSVRTRSDRESETDSRQLSEREYGH